MRLLLVMMEIGWRYSSRTSRIARVIRYCFSRGWYASVLTPRAMG